MPQCLALLGGCSLSYTRADHLRDHLRVKHSWAREKCLEEVRRTRRGICPDCRKVLSNVAKHRKLSCPIIKAQEAGPKKKTVQRPERERSNGAPCLL